MGTETIFLWHYDFQGVGQVQPKPVGAFSTLRMRERGRGLVMLSLKLLVWHKIAVA